MNSMEELPGKTRKAKYLKFLSTPFWKDLSWHVRKQAGKCSRCGLTHHLQAHHKFYRSNWFNTLPDDLEVLCQWCHHTHHSKAAKLAASRPGWNRMSPKQRKKAIRKERNRLRNLRRQNREKAVILKSTFFVAPEATSPGVLGLLIR